MRTRGGRWAGVKHTLAVHSGSGALRVALRAIEIGPGDEMLVPASTFIATALAVLNADDCLAVADAMNRATERVYAAAKSRQRAPAGGTRHNRRNILAQAA
ncbi:MAG: DegT/DnrJ/EryC1/StrS family aminotransferase [Verrucomicrobia bacterium]|nr:DegT/DnrJ/EryC1/StrS family aminotransferase [Verrucomicrobiota bacterium]